jgi:hypothetical protein
VAKWTKTHPTKSGYYWVAAKGLEQPFIRLALLYRMHVTKGPPEIPDSAYIDGDNYSLHDAPIGPCYIAFWDEPVIPPELPVG